MKSALADAQYFELRVSLDEIKPLIWRRFVVPATITLDLLHDVLQIVMGWEDYHLHRFTFGERRFREDPEQTEEGEEEWGVVLGDLITKVKTQFHYLYDFGDGWQHTITVERVAKVPPDHSVEISCLEGKRNGPPEDVGGFPGYINYLKVIANRRHPEHEDMLRWRGEFDPEEFDLEDVNRELTKLARWSRRRQH